MASLHVHGNPDSQDEWLDDLLGRGKGDPDILGHYPGEDPKAQNQDKNDILALTDRLLSIVPPTKIS